MSGSVVYTASGGQLFSVNESVPSAGNSMTFTPQFNSDTTGATTLTFTSTSTPGTFQVNATYVNYDGHGDTTTNNLGNFSSTNFQSANGIVLTSASDGGTYYLAGTSTAATPTQITVTNNLGQTFDNGALSTTVVACFVSGTRIATPAGEVAVEDLAEGDLVMTASGEARPVRWVGHSRVRCGIPADGAAHRMWPVRIAAHAFAPNVPERDVFVSPGHSIAVRVMDEVFIPAGELINGATIAQVPCEDVSYWHVELDSHDVLLSSGLPSESYINVGNRATFTIGEGNVDPVHDAATLADYARPFVNAGPVVDAVRARLSDRAEQMGWGMTHDMDMHLVVDGQRVDADVDGDRARFIFPATARTVQLVSRTFRPSEWAATSDVRALGLCVDGLRISDGLRCDMALALNDPRLETLFHAEEAQADCGWCWTRTVATLPAELWADCRSYVMFSLDFRPEASRAWVAPQSVADVEQAPHHLRIVA